jgi:hypothetical protein
MSGRKADLRFGSLSTVRHTTTVLPKMVWVSKMVWVRMRVGLNAA